jgi:hypothetical protein
MNVFNVAVPLGDSTKSLDEFRALCSSMDWSLRTGVKRAMDEMVKRHRSLPSDEEHLMADKQKPEEIMQDILNRTDMP